MRITVTIMVEDHTDTKRVREISISDGGAYGNPLAPSRMRSKALSRTKVALADLVVDDPPDGSAP